LTSNRKISNYNCVDIILFVIAICKACNENKPSRTSKGYKNLDSIKHHTFRCKNFDSHSPTRDEVLLAIKRTQIKFGKNASLDQVPEFHEWGVLRH